MPISEQTTATKVTGAISRLNQPARQTEATYVYYDLGLVDRASGGESTFFIHIYDNTVAIDYVILEGCLDDEGPWDTLDSGTAIAASVDPTVPTVTLSGVFYGGIIRVGIKHTTTQGLVSIKMLAK